ncbi:TPA: hypothetical protein DEB00_02580 [Candidatus Uhrbacteria bacterium]|nr:hypothetical protein [Candidatus Uhrbacteria bacterium]
MKKLKNTLDLFVTSLPFSYFSTPLYLDFAAYTFDRNEEQLVVMQDIVCPHEFPSLFLPTNPLNWENCSITFTRAEDIARIRTEEIEILVEKPLDAEYFYATEAFVEPAGSFAKKIRSFTSKYTYRVLPSYDRSGIEAFYKNWKTQKKEPSITFDESEELYLFCLDHLDDYAIKQVYVEVEGALVGFAWGMAHPNGGWVGLHLKVDYAYSGLSRFLHHERAKQFASTAQFTLGTGSFEQGISQYKQELHPSVVTPYSYILTGGRRAPMAE